MSENPTSECKNSPCHQLGVFNWNTLVATDVEGAIAFYTSLFGWTTTAFSPEYTTFHQDGRAIGGVTQSCTPESPAQWVSYVTVENVDDSVIKALTLGGQIRLPAMDITQVGRIAVLVDGQGAVFGVFQPTQLA
jgi:hypothetical protein